MLKTNSSFSSSTFFSVYPIEEMRSERTRDRDAAEVEESWKGLNSGGDASKSDKKFWDILKTRVVGRRRESGIREGCDTFRSRWCNGHSAEQVTETTGKRRGKDIVVDMSLRLEHWDSRNHTEHARWTDGVVCGTSFILSATVLCDVYSWVQVLHISFTFKFDVTF